MDALAPTFGAALTDADAKVHSLTLAQLVDAHRAGSVSTADVLSAYGKKAFAAQKATNCLADVMLSDLLILHPKPDPAPAHIDDDDDDDDGFCDPLREAQIGFASTFGPEAGRRSGSCWGPSSAQGWARRRQRLARGRRDQDRARARA